MSEQEQPDANAIVRTYRIGVNQQTEDDLVHLRSLEELNVTTIMNRAVQLYRMLDSERRAGHRILVEEDTPNEFSIVRWV